MTNQEAYDKIRAHLLSMKERCVEYNHLDQPSVYNGDFGAHCAIGILLEDIHLPGSKNRTNIFDLISTNDAVKERLEGIDMGLLRSCQAIHDASASWARVPVSPGRHDWAGLKVNAKDDLDALASKWSLNVNETDHS